MSKHRIAVATILSLGLLAGGLVAAEALKSGPQTGKKVLAGAGLGAAIGAIGGNAGKGAAIGAVSGVGLAAVKKGEPIRVPSETLLEFTISQPTRLPVSK